MAGKKNSEFNTYIIHGQQPMQSKIKHAGNSLDIFIEQKIKRKMINTSLNPLADTFIFNRASEFCCHAVNNSLSYFTECTEVRVLGTRVVTETNGHRDKRSSEILT